MTKINMTATRSVLVVWTLLVVPLVVVFSFVGLLLSFSDVPDWAFVIGSFVALGAALGATLFVLKRFMSVTCEVGASANEFSFLREQSNPFFPKNLNCGWDNVLNVSKNYDKSHEKQFYQVSLRKPSMTLSLSPQEGVIDAEEQADVFWVALEAHVAAFNARSLAQATHASVSHLGFYDAWWAKYLTYSSWLLVVVFVVLKIQDPAHVSILKLIAFICMTFAWNANYFANRKAKN